MSLNQEFTGDINVLGEIKKNGVAVGGGSLYLHHIVISYSGTIRGDVFIYTNDNTPFTSRTLATFLEYHGSQPICARPYWSEDDGAFRFWILIGQSGGALRRLQLTKADNGEWKQGVDINSDNVYQI